MKGTNAADLIVLRGGKNNYNRFEWIAQCTSLLPKNNIHDA